MEAGADDFGKRKKTASSKMADSSHQNTDPSSSAAKRSKGDSSPRGSFKRNGVNSPRIASTDGGSSPRLELDALDGIGDGDYDEYGAYLDDIGPGLDDQMGDGDGAPYASGSSGLEVEVGVGVSYSSDDPNHPTLSRSGVRSAASLVQPPHFSLTVDTSLSVPHYGDFLPSHLIGSGADGYGHSSTKSTVGGGGSSRSSRPPSSGRYSRPRSKSSGSRKSSSTPRAPPPSRHRIVSISSRLLSLLFSEEPMTVSDIASSLPEVSADMVRGILDVFAVLGIVVQYKAPRTPAATSTYSSSKSHHSGTAVGSSSSTPSSGSPPLFGIAAFGRGVGVPDFANLAEQNRATRKRIDDTNDRIREFQLLVAKDMPQEEKKQAAMELAQKYTGDPALQDDPLMQIFLP